MKIINFDHNATTPLDPIILKEMIPWMSDPNLSGNPSSKHQLGNNALIGTEQARQMVASLISANPNDIYFTSGATESNNFAIRGLKSTFPDLLISCSLVEHSSVLETATCVSKVSNCNNVKGFIPITVDPSGNIDIGPLHNIIQASNQHPWLVSVMLGNNETGNVNNIHLIDDLLFQVKREFNIQNLWLHVDASQGLGYFNLSVARAKTLALMSLSSHKISGPKGIGALWIHPQVLPYMTPLLTGGGQERGLRGGTLNVPAIVGFGKACQIMKQVGQTQDNRLRLMKSFLIDNLVNSLHAIVNGRTDLQTLPHTVNLYLPGVDAETLMMGLNHVVLSTGSACHAHSQTPSHVLQAMFPNEHVRLSQSIRISLGRFTTEQEIIEGLDEIIKVANLAKR